MLMENTQPNPDSSVNIGQPRGTPWASVVRGDLEPSSSQTERAASNDVVMIPGSEPQLEPAAITESDNNGVSRKPAWVKPSNGGDVPGFVMSGTWPTLSEIRQPIQRSMSDCSNGSSGSPSSSQAPIVTQPPPRPTNTNDHGSNTTPRVRHRNRNGGGPSASGQPHTAVNQQPRPVTPQFPVSDVPGRMVPPVLDVPLRGQRPVGGASGFPSHSVNDHSSLRHNPRRGGFGPRPRGDVQYPNNHGVRRDQDHRDVRPPPKYGPAPVDYMPSPVPGGFGPYMPHMSIFHGQMGFVPEMQPPLIYFQTLQPDTFRPMSIGPPPPPPPMINPVTIEIINQINYYFSDMNLVTDIHLRSNMDDCGWVPVSVIAAFPRVRRLTQDISLILESLRSSAIVEVQDDKLRRRNVWSKWLLPPGTINFISGGGRATSESALGASLQKVSLEDGEGQNRSASGESSTGQLRLANGAATAEEIHLCS